MTVSEKVALIASQFFLGLASGGLGLLMFSLLASYLQMGLFESILYGFITGYITMFLGFSIISYYVLRQMHKESKFKSAFITSSVGMLISMLFLWSAIAQSSDLIGMYVFPIFLPIILTTLAFHVGLIDK